MALCVTDSDITRQPTVVQVACKVLLPGRFVTIRRLAFGRPPEYQTLVLCEVSPIAKLGKRAMLSPCQQCSEYLKYCQVGIQQPPHVHW